MARRCTSQSFDVEEVFDQLTHAPIWAGPILPVMMYAMSRWVFSWLLTSIVGGSTFGGSIAQTLSIFAVRAAPFLGGGILVLWIAAEFKKWIDRRRFEQQSGSRSIGTLGWRDFELFLAEAFRRQGFVVEHSGRDGSDGGIDIFLSKAGAVTLVQCKHWKRLQVGVQVVRELLGVVISEGAQSGIVVTSGQFTTDAIEFAAKNAIRLIDGRELVRMIADLQASGRVKDRCSETAAVTVLSQQHTAPLVCPQCGAPLVKKLAKRGARMGSEFFGCSAFPGCRYTHEFVH